MEPNGPNTCLFISLFKYYIGKRKIGSCIFPHYLIIYRQTVRQTNRQTDTQARTHKHRTSHLSRSSQQMFPIGHLKGFFFLNVACSDKSLWFSISRKNTMDPVSYSELPTALPSTLLSFPLSAITSLFLLQHLIAITHKWSYCKNYNITYSNWSSIWPTIKCTVYNAKHRHGCNQVQHL